VWRTELQVTPAIFSLAVEERGTRSRRDGDQDLCLRAEWHADGFRSETWFQLRGSGCPACTVKMREARNR